MNIWPDGGYGGKQSGPQCQKGSYYGAFVHDFVLCRLLYVTDAASIAKSLFYSKLTAASVVCFTSQFWWFFTENWATEDW